MRLDVENAVLCVRTLAAMGIRIESVSMSPETQCEIENAAIVVGDMTILTDNRSGVDMFKIPPRTFCGAKVNLQR